MPNVSREYNSVLCKLECKYTAWMKRRKDGTWMTPVFVQGPYKGMTVIDATLAEMKNPQVS